MNGNLPRFGSKRFRETFWPALIAEPLAALGGLYWFATRRRVRGWSTLMIAASEAPDAYKRWIAQGELRAFADFRRSHRLKRSATIIPLIFADEELDQDLVACSVESVRAAFGEEVPIRVQRNGSLVAALSSVGNEPEGAWLLPVLAGDVISPVIGEMLARALEDSAGAALVYWDEDRFGPRGRCDPWIKPDWDKLLFGRLGGLLGSCIVSLAEARMAASAMPEISQDRIGTERLLMSLEGDKPAHVPLFLTHRHERNGLRRDTEARPASAVSAAPWPSVAILVPTRDRAELLAACLRGIDETSYPGTVELIVIDNGSKDAAAVRLIDALAGDRRTTVLREPGPFNFSRLNNKAAAIAESEFLCFLNNDVEPLDKDWLTAMVSRAVEDRVGAVGALLLYPSGNIQHAGVAIGIGGAAGHVQKGVDPSDRRFWTWHSVTREVSAVTAAAMVIRKSTFLGVGGFDEVAFPVAFNDVDLCLRLKQAGVCNLFVAEARLLHRESETRGDDQSPAPAKRFAAELKRLQERWHTSDFVDPHFSPLFSRMVGRCVLAP